MARKKKRGLKNFFTGPAILRGILMLLIFGAFAIFALHQISTLDQDLGRHLKTGELIWESKFVPRADLFSFVESDQPAPASGWLAGLIFFGAYRLGGFIGLQILSAVFLTLGFGLAFALAWNKRFFIFSSLASVLGAGLVLARSEIRPEIFGFFCFALFSFILAANRQKINWSFWFLPLLQLFWVNLDDSFWLGWLLAFLFLLDRLWNRRKEIYLSIRKRIWDKFILKTGIIFLTLFVVSLANPAGWRGLLFIFLPGSGEGQAFSFSGARILFGAVLVPLVLFFVFNFRQFGFFEAAGIIILALAAWFNPEYLPFLGLAALPVLTGNFAILRQRYAKILLKWEFSRSRPVLRLLTVLLLFVILIGSIYVAFSPRLSAKIGKEKFGFGRTRAGAEAAVDFLEESGISGRMFNDVFLGDYLIWRLYPEQKVFIDSRTRAYSPELLGDYQKMENDPSSWSDLSQKYGFELAIWSNGKGRSSFPGIIQGAPEWTMVYLDENASVWLRESEGSREWLEKYGLDEQKLRQKAAELINSAGHDGLENLGYFFQAIGENDLAVSVFERALEGSPSREMAFELGKAYVQSGEKEKAIHAFKKSVFLDKKFVPAYISLGETLYQNADFSEARQAWEKALEIDSNNREAKFYIENMGLIPFKK